MKTRKQIIEEYTSKGYTIGTFNDIEDSIDYVSENTLIFLNNDKSGFFLEDVCPRYEGDMEDVDFVEYAKYIKTKQWKTLASNTKEKANNKCIFCESTKRLLAHHRTYKNLYNEKENDLICVCNKCHIALHNGCSCRKTKTLCNVCEFLKNDNTILFNYLYSNM